MEHTWLKAEREDKETEGPPRGKRVSEYFLGIQRPWKSEKQKKSPTDTWDPQIAVSALGRQGIHIRKKWEEMMTLGLQGLSRGV